MPSCRAAAVPSWRRAVEPSCRHAVVSRRLIAAAGALALLTTACEDLTLPGGGSRSAADLVILPVAAAAPAPPGVSSYVSNRHSTTLSLIHPDGFNTLFAQIAFPAGALTSLDGAPLGADDSVQVTVTADAGIYGVLIAPAGLAFTASGAPTLTLRYVKYGDLTVAAGTHYTGLTDYAAALAVWGETGLDRWTETGALGTPGSYVGATLSQAGHYIAAAPR